ncbi:MAG TPA: hydroxysqualene dehydroxylase HpnE [Blastocatellia bacterium]|nr:hydroxysqualene dehydroxylase HpnE [Blastocatellia bacterium]
MGRHVAIIGGGFSGLAAGVALTEKGAQVTLLERRGNLGGRAYSFTDPTTGDVVDNGQHLFMACYHNTIEFLDKIGCRDRLKFQSNTHVDFLDRENGLTPFDCPSLPAPFHALIGLMKMKGLSMGDKLGMLRAARAFRPGANGASGLTVEEWLTGLGQSAAIRERFWYPMAIATLNESPSVASARMLKKVLELGFGGKQSESKIGIARVGLSDLYVHAAREFIQSRGGTIRERADVRALVMSSQTIDGCQLSDGEVIKADCYISAVTPPAFLGILPESLRQGAFAGISELRSSPIVSVNLWFDRPVTDCEFAGLIGTNIQWLFNKDVISPAGRKSNHLALVISAAHKYTGLTRESLVEMAVRELRDVMPSARAAKVVHSRIVKEREATISHTIQSDRLRPDMITPVENLILAGDWTNTGLPATIEGAVLSGNSAAEYAAHI